MPTIVFRVAADVVVLLHLAFVLFVILGGLLALRWGWIKWLHLPAAAWGIAIEFGGWICPLTPLENYLRVRSGQAAYAGDFIEHYVLALLYPESLTRGTQFMLGGIVLTVNACIYWYLLGSRRRPASQRSSSARVVR